MPDTTFRIGRLEAGIWELSNRVKKANPCHDPSTGKFCSHRVYVDRAYFPSASYKPGDEAFETWKVKAPSRQAAAEKVWAEHGERLLSLMKPHEGKLPRKISLYVSGTKGKTKPGRLQPITVYTATAVVENKT